MGIFSGVLLVSDLDGTLLDKDEKVSAENIRALTYFKENGGILTFASGRNAENMHVATNYIAPNAPIIADNGSIIADFESGRHIWEMLLNQDVLPVVKEIHEAFSLSSLEIYQPDQIYICNENPFIKRAPYFVRDAIFNVPYTKIALPWSKVVFMQPDDETEKMREFVLQKPYYNDYTFFKADHCFFEILNKHASKGDALRHLKTLLPEIRLTISAGDNENDIALIKEADIGYATENASPLLLAKADRVTSSNENSALAQIVEDIKKLVNF